MRSRSVNYLGERRPAPVQVASLLSEQSDENLGRSLVLLPETIQNQTVLQVNLKDSPSAGEMVTIHLRSERDTFEGPPEVGVPNPIGTIEFGHGGDRSGRLELDWDHGTQVTVPAGSLRVMARMPIDNGALDAVRVGTFIARGCRSGGCCGPRRTLASTSLVTATLGVPLGSKALTVWDLLSPTTVNWLDHVGAVIGSYQVDALGNPPPGPVPVPPTARAVSILGAHAAQLVFDLEG